MADKRLMVAFNWGRTESDVDAHGKSYTYGHEVSQKLVNLLPAIFYHNSSVIYTVQLGKLKLCLYGGNPVAFEWEGEMVCMQSPNKNTGLGRALNFFQSDKKKRIPVNEFVDRLLSLMVRMGVLDATDAVEQVS